MSIIVKSIINPRTMKKNKDFFASLPIEKQSHDRETTPIVTFHPKKGLLLFTAGGQFIGSTMEIKLIDGNDDGFWLAEIKLLVKAENLEQE